MNEFSIFVKYIVSPSGFLKDLFSGVKDLLHPKRLSILFLIIAVISSILLPYNKKLVAGMFLFLALLMQFRIIYVAGDHNRWRKEKIYNLSQREVKKDKDEAHNVALSGDTNRDQGKTMNVEHILGKEDNRLSSGVKEKWE